VATKSTSTAKSTAAKKTAAKKTTARKAPAKKAVADTRRVTGEDTLTTPPEQPNEEAALQHPAFAGEPGVEVAERSADVTKPDTTTHRKDFVLQREAFEGNDQTEIHTANIAATRQYLISQGMRPTGDGKFAGSDNLPDGLNVVLHYDVPVTPAVTATVDDEGVAVVHAHVTLDDQHAAEDAAS
jgi:hypothetical protein